MEKKKSSTQAAEEAAIRLLGETNGKSILFTTENAPGKNAFTVYVENGRICISALDGVSFLCGLNWYLRYVCEKQITWETSLPVKLEEGLPVDFEAVTMHSPYRYRYFLNYCTYSYSMAFWDWERWEKELDLMALGGVNLALSLTGQEAVIRETLLGLGMDAEDVDAYMPGAVYYAWFFMGNMSSFGQRLPEQWYKDRIELARKIHTRMEELGIMPVLPGFYGLVPETLEKKFPSVQMIKQGKWCGFSRQAYLSNEDPMFEKIAGLYYQNQRKMIGDITPYFAAEPFHEGGRREGICLPDYGAAIKKKMDEYRADAVWVLQAWDKNPSLSLFEKVNRESVLILNLLSGRVQDSYRITDEFGGLPWIYCPVHSYGGRNSMYGFLRTMAREPLEILKCEGSLCGIGLAPESIETNPVFYDLFWDMTYRDQPLEVSDWIRGYVDRRYGKAPEEALLAWKFLEDSVYNSFVPQPGGAESFICARPDLGLTSVSTWGPKQVNYDMDYIKKAGRLLLSKRKELWGSEGFQYDLVDVTRQCLANESRVLYARLMYCMEQGRKHEFITEKKRFLELVRIQDKVLSRHEAFGLNRFLNGAAECGRKYGLEREFIIQAKTLITVWGDERCDVLHDYSSREWSGITGTLYYDRWEKFLDVLENGMRTGEEMDGAVSLTRDWEEEKIRQGERKEAKMPDSSYWYRMEKEWADSAEIPAAAENEGITIFEKAYGEFIS